MSWSNSGLARQLEYGPADYQESYYLNDASADIYVEDQVAHNISRLRVRAASFARLFFLLFVYGMALVFISNTTATMGYDVAKMEKDIVSLENQNKRLEVEIAELKSLERIEQVAINDLHMVHSGRKDSLVLDKSLIGSEPAAQNPSGTTARTGTQAQDSLADQLGLWLYNTISGI